MSETTKWDDSALQDHVAQQIRERLVALAGHYVREFTRLLYAAKHGRVYGAEQTVNFVAARAGTGGAFPFRVVQFVANRGKKLGGKGRHGSRVHRASAPGEAPANLTYALVRGITFEITEKDGAWFAAIGPSVQSGRSKIAEYLEFGTSKIQPRPAWRTALERLVSAGETAIRAGG